MFALAVFIGIYSYGIFLLGILGILTGLNIAGLTLSWLIIFIFYISGKDFRFQISDFRLNRKQTVLFGLLITQLLVNLIGTLGPELGFDALWYHLSLPKIWLMEHLIRFIPGSVYKYSVMPKLAESLYVLPLTFTNEIGAKLIHYIFGVLTLIVTYKIARKYLPLGYRLLTLLLLSGNLVFSWQSITAYTDLARTFFEILALYLFMDKKIIPSAITLGLAVTTKLLSLVSLPIYIILLFREKYPLKITVYYFNSASLVYFFLYQYR
jgi:Gpi18-like mannosyltransferase